MPHGLLTPIITLLKWSGIGKDWTIEAQSRSKLADRPDVLRFLGSSDEAYKLRQEYAGLVMKALEDLEGVSMDWDTVAATMKSCAFKVLGPTPTRRSLPWLQGKGISCLNRTSDCRILLNECRKASKDLLSAKRRWEAQWWDDLAEKAQSASDNHDEFSFWQASGDSTKSPNAQWRTQWQTERPGRIF